MQNKKQLISGIVFLLLLIVLTIFIYKPGLSGGFLLDDDKQLTKLSCINGEQYTLSSLKCFFAYDSAGPLKRPFSVITFLFDADQWPAIPSPFLRTNIIIHVVNGLLLFVFLSKFFGQVSRYINHKYTIAFIGAGLWLLNPFFVSTVLYIVQRMAMIPATFTLLGMYLYLSGRIKYEKKPSINNKISMFVAMYVFPILAALSKENGVLLVFLLALFENIICIYYFNYQQLNKKLKRWLINIPVAMLFFAIVAIIPYYYQAYEFRDFTLYERILSESRALTKYLYHLFVPDYFTEGIFSDGFQKSSGIFQPIETFFSIIFIGGLIYFSYIKRKKYPLIAFSLLFFFIAHSMESSIFALELYFEHRNYVPALFIFVPLAVVFTQLITKSKIVYVIIFAILILVSFTTYMRTNFWSNNFVMQTSSMKKFPESKRARGTTATLYYGSGMESVTVDILEEGMHRFDEIEFDLNHAIVKCILNDMQTDDFDILIQAMQDGIFFRNDMLTFGVLIGHLLEKRCIKGDEDRYIEKLMLVFQNHPNLLGKSLAKQTVYTLRAKIALSKNDFDSAKAYYIQYFDEKNNYTYMLDIIREFIKQKEFSNARDILNYIKTKFKMRHFLSIDWFGIEQQIDEISQELDENNYEN